jgi:hypothetical protein
VAEGVFLLLYTDSHASRLVSWASLRPIAAARIASSVVTMRQHSSADQSRGCCSPGVSPCAPLPLRSLFHERTWLFSLAGAEIACVCFSSACAVNDLHSSAEMVCLVATRLSWSPSVLFDVAELAK